jgi:hypothetical protein
MRTEDGTIRHLEPPDYHGNPISEKGSLVITEWGRDLCDVIYQSSGMTTTAILIRDTRLGLAGEFCEVFISGNPHLKPTAQKLPNLLKMVSPRWFFLTTLAGAKPRMPEYSCAT